MNSAAAVRFCVVLSILNTWFIQYAAFLYGVVSGGIVSRVCVYRKNCQEIPGQIFFWAGYRKSGAQICESLSLKFPNQNRHRQHQSGESECSYLCFSVSVKVNHHLVIHHDFIRTLAVMRHGHVLPLQML